MKFKCKQIILDLSKLSNNDVIQFSTDTADSMRMVIPMDFMTEDDFYEDERIYHVIPYRCIPNSFECL